MNTGRHLNDIVASRALARNSNEESVDGQYDASSHDERPSQPPQQQRQQLRQPSLMDMLMNGNANNANETTSITVGGRRDISPAVVDFLHVTTSKKAGTPPVTQEPAERVPLEIIFAARYSERIARINNKIIHREDDNELDEVEDELVEPESDHRRDEDEAMMRELFGEAEHSGEEQHQHPPVPQTVARQTKRKRPNNILPSSKESCFLCQFGDRYHDGIRAPHIARINNIIDTFYGKMSNYDLANCVVLYFNNKVYSVTDNIPQLHVHVVLEHIEGRHSLSAMNFLIESIRVYEDIKFILRDMLFRVDGTIDKDAFLMLDKVQAKLEKLYTMNIDKMNFNDGQTTENLNSKGAYVNLMPMFSQREDYNNRLKRKADHIESATTRFDL